MKPTIRELIAPYASVSIIGMCKNAGKTTVLNQIIKEVNGILADYEKDATYWGFYINGEYAMTGADMTDAVDGDSYLFKVEK